MNGGSSFIEACIFGALIYISMTLGEILRAVQRAHPGENGHASARSVSDE